MTTSTGNPASHSIASSTCTYTGGNQVTMMAQAAHGFRRRVHVRVHAMCASAS